MLGSSAKIQCVSDSDVVWEFKGKPITNFSCTQIKDEEYLLTILSITKHNVGEYTCYGRDMRDDKYSSFYSYSKIILTGS